MDSLKTKEIASLFRVSDNTIRYYTDIGVLSVERNKNNYRSFSTFDFMKTLGIMELRRAGVSIEGIKEYVQSPRFESLKAALVETEQTLIEKELELKEQRQYLRNAIDSFTRLRNRNVIKTAVSPCWYALPVPLDYQIMMDKMFLMKDHCNGVCLPSSQIDREAFLKNDVNYIAEGNLVVSEVNPDTEIDGLVLLKPRNSVYCMYVGAFEELAERYKAIHSWMNERGLEPDDPIREIILFLNNWGCAIEIWVPIKEM